MGSLPHAPLRTRDRDPGGPDLRFDLRALAACLLVALGARPAFAQPGGPAPPDTLITAATRQAVLDTLADRLDRFYVFPDVAKTAVKALRQRAARREYEALASANAFADSLTAHLQAASRDRHLRVRWVPGAIPPAISDDSLTPGKAAQAREELRLTNFGFERIQRLAGNVGYLDLRRFAPPGLGAGETAAAAMNTLGGCDALIVDLRRSGGGDPLMADLLISYLYEPWERIHVNDFVNRTERGLETEQYWTSPWVPGPHLAHRDVYVLTGPFTFSCAEEFAYDLQCLKRGTLVGETTGGGANPGSVRPLDHHFAVFVPTGRAQNPVTRTNWEGAGVKPDVAVPADSALAVAHGMALEKLLAKAQDGDDRDRLGRALEQARKAPLEALEERFRRRR